MDLDALYKQGPHKNHLVLNWSEERGFFLVKKIKSLEQARHVLARFYQAFPDSHFPNHFAYLPSVLRQNGFLSMYAEGMMISEKLFRKIYEHSRESQLRVTVGFTQDYASYYDVKAVPPGLPPKFSSKLRKKIDPELTQFVEEDLKRAAEITEKQKRVWVTLALLSHGAAYRDLEGRVLLIPSFENAGQLIPYACKEHMIWEGVKTISLSPLEREHEERAIYLCQGTEIWPSQPMMLGSIFANLSRQGAATEPYAHSWRQIHKHLEELRAKTNRLPFVTGHSMGGALATQMALYSHAQIERAFAFNPPVVGKRDYELFHNLPLPVQKKLFVFASIDDMPFWRMGSYVIGQVHILLGERRSKYYPLRKIDRAFLFPALIKAYFNFKHMVPSHQDIVLLMRSYVVALLTPEEIEIENSERRKRSGYLRFISKLYGLNRLVLNFTRKYLHWEKKLDYLKSRLEILELHEKDLKETLLLMPGENRLEGELLKLQKEKERLLEEIENLINS